jgi:hypothetical protein
VKEVPLRLSPSVQTAPTHVTLRQSAQRWTTK